MSERRLIGGKDPDPTFRDLLKGRWYRHQKDEQVRRQEAESRKWEDVRASAITLLNLADHEVDDLEVLDINGMLVGRYEDVTVVPHYGVFYLVSKCPKCNETVPGRWPITNTLDLGRFLVEHDEGRFTPSTAHRLNCPGLTEEEREDLVQDEDEANGAPPDLLEQLGEVITKIVREKWDLV